MRGATSPTSRSDPSRFLPTAFVLPAQEGVKGYNDITPRGGARLRRVRQRQHGVEGERRQVPRGGDQPHHLLAEQSGRARRRQPGARRAAGGDADRGPTPTATTCPTAICSNPLANDSRPTGGDFCGALSNANFGKPIFSGSFDPDDARRLARAAERLAGRRLGAAEGAHRRVGGSRLLPPLAAELHRRRQPGGVGQRLRYASASPRRPIRGCRTAAATPSPGCTTSRRRGSGRPTA